MIEPEMRLFQGHDLEINAAVWEGGPSTVLCLHGITANCRTWDLVANALSPEYRVIAVDLRGRGLSDKPDAGYSPENHIRDILSLMDGLGLEKVMVMGHSLGAFISLMFAATHPGRVEKLVLVDGAGDLDEAQMDKVFSGIKPALDRLEMRFPTEDAYMDFMKAGPAVQPWQPNIEAYYRHEMETGEDGVKTNINPAHIAEEAGNVRKLDCAALYGRVQCPVLILRADQGLLQADDLLLPEDAIEKMVDQIPQAERFDVSGTNHYGILFQPHGDRDRAVREFFRGSDRG